MNRAVAVDRQPARSDSQAKARFLRHLNQTVQAVSQTTHWMARASAGAWFAYTVPSDVMALRTRDGRHLYLESWFKFAYCDHPLFPGERKVRTLKYAHHVGDEPELESQLFAWEWDSAASVQPHVHVDRGRAEAKGFGKLHVPTGRVFLEQIVTFLIRDMGVVPQRDDWADVLGGNLDRVSRYATWGGVAHDLSAN